MLSQEHKKIYLVASVYVPIICEKDVITQNYVYTYKKLQAHVLIVVCHEK
jgi:hypothetical protein